MRPPPRRSSVGTDRRASGGGVVPRRALAGGIGGLVQAAQHAAEMVGQGEGAKDAAQEEAVQTEGVVPGDEAPVAIRISVVKAPPEEGEEGRPRKRRLLFLEEGDPRVAAEEKRRDMEVLRSNDFLRSLRRAFIPQYAGHRQGQRAPWASRATSPLVGGVA